MITAEELFTILLTGTKGINVYTFQARSGFPSSALIATSSIREIRLRAKTVKQHSQSD